MVFQIQAVEAQTPVQVTVNAPAEVEVGSEILLPWTWMSVNFDAADLELPITRTSSS
jgi:hypothetical protein